ncbi:hypothetical protein FACS189428_3750 [Clostridia bacterium]|nr:hypothetical protein FACS189428_3750 [Clostridia bacterium]
MVNFISRVENDTDRKILCQIAYAKGLLWSENISALIKGSGLKETDFSFNEQEKVDTITGDRLVDPWELAVAGRKGKRNEKDISFEDLDFEDEGTLIKNIVRDINKLGVFTVAKDAQITTLLIDPQKSDLKTIFSALYTKVSAEKESSAERKQDIANLLSQAKSLKVELDEKWDSWLKEDEKKPEETSTAGARTTSQAEHKNMTTIEKERKSSAYEKLIELKIDTPENRAKIDAVKFGTNYVEI